MRRLMVEEPYAASAVWTRRFAMMGALFALVAVLAGHRPSVQPEDALGILGMGLLCALLALLCALKAVASIWRTGRKGTGRVLLGLLVAGATLAYPGYLAALGLGRPVTSAATTDAKDPPRFSLSTKAFAVRGDSRALEHARALLTDDLHPIVLDLDEAEAFDAVEKAVETLRWRMIEAVAPGGRLGLGHVDAVTYSPVMHLPQDIAIRIRPLAGQTRIDIRSGARLGLYDFGESVKTIRQLGDAVQDEADDQ